MICNLVLKCIISPNLCLSSQTPAIVKYLKIWKVLGTFIVIPSLVVQISGPLRQKAGLYLSTLSKQGTQHSNTQGFLSLFPEQFSGSYVNRFLDSAVYTITGSSYKGEAELCTPTCPLLYCDHPLLLPLFLYVFAPCEA